MATARTDARAHIMAPSEVIDLTSLSDSDAENGESHRVGTSEDRASGDSEDSEIEITLNAETRAQLQKAIATVSEPRLRLLLCRLVQSDRGVEAALSKELLTLPRRSRDVVPRWEICANCDEEYDINSVFEGAPPCAFHPGDLEVCEEAFVDWDEDVHGPMDSNRNRTEYPENFTWSCCENDGTSDGCVRECLVSYPARKRLDSTTTSMRPSSWFYDSSSPYPPTSPSNSDVEDIRGSIGTMSNIRSSIAVLPDEKLRELMLKLANRDSRFLRAITKEISLMEKDASPTTPTTPVPTKHPRWHRKSSVDVKNWSIATTSGCSHSEIGYMYHPGRLEEEIYEFISVIPDRTHVVRKVMMWNCCDEDEWSSGCLSMPVDSDAEQSV